MKEIGCVHGKYNSYVIKEDSGVFSSKYYIIRNDGKTYGYYKSRAEAFRAAHEKGGPKSYEGRP